MDFGPIPLWRELNGQTYIKEITVDESPIAQLDLPPGMIDFGVGQPGPALNYHKYHLRRKVLNNIFQNIIHFYKAFQAHPFVHRVGAVSGRAEQNRRYAYCSGQG